LSQKRYASKPKGCYRPDEILSSILADALQLEKEAGKIQKEIVAGGGGITQASMIKKQEEWKSKKRNLDKRKVNVLDSCIFPSMANLTVLLEAMADSGLIERMFEGDLKSLFFSKSRALSIKSKVAEDRYKASRAIFSRFVNASCKLVIHKTETGEYTDLDESRAILYNIMMEAINDAIWYIGLKGIGQIKFGNTFEFLQRTLGPDLDRVRAWTQLFAWEADKQLTVDEDRRPALF
jgi:hypothetical protein